MCADETFDRHPGLEREWMKQEAVRTRVGASPQARDADDGYGLVFELIGDAHDLQPPAGLAADIGHAVESYVEGARRVESFRRAIRRWASVPMAAVVVVAVFCLDSGDITALYRVPSWIYVLGAALFAGMLPLRRNRAGATSRG